MRKKIIVISLLLIFGHLLAEAAWVIELSWPESKDLYVHPFLNYDWPHDERGIALLWWIKYVCEDILWIIAFGSMTLITLEYSRRLGILSGIWLVYHIADHWMLWWNYRQGYMMYAVLLVSAIISIFILVIPNRKLRAVKTQLRSI